MPRVPAWATSADAIRAIDSEKGEFHLAALKRKEKPDAVKKTKDLIQSRLKRTDLVDLLIADRFGVRAF